jgi:hypothetical protein
VVEGAKQALAMMARIAQRGSRRTTQVQRQAHRLQQEIPKVMRGFGRQCRGHGHVLVQLVRHTEQQLLELGQPIPALGQQAQQLLTQAPALSDATRQRLAEAFHAAMHSHTHIRQQSPPRTQGKKLHHCQLVKAYELTMAPILTGKSNCPAQFGRKPGSASEPATGFLFATRVPEGNPNAASSVLPWLAKVQSAIERVQTPPKLRLHAVAGDLGVNDAARRQALHARGILTVGIPQSLTPIAPKPGAEEGGAILTEAGLHRQRPPYQVPLACACGSSRPVVERHIASLLARGVGQVRYTGPLGAMRQQGMTVRAHNGATLVRIHQQHLSKRAQKFRRLLGLRYRKSNEINGQKN